MHLDAALAVFLGDQVAGYIHWLPKAELYEFAAQDANASPVLITHRDLDEIKRLIERKLKIET